MAFGRKKKNQAEVVATSSESSLNNEIVQLDVKKQEAEDKRKEPIKFVALAAVAAVALFFFTGGLGLPVYAALGVAALSGAKMVYHHKQVKDLEREIEKKSSQNSGVKDKDDSNDKSEERGQGQGQGKTKSEPGMPHKIELEDVGIEDAEVNSSAKFESVDLNSEDNSRENDNNAPAPPRRGRRGTGGGGRGRG